MPFERIELRFDVMFESDVWKILCRVVGTASEASSTSAASAAKPTIARAAPDDGGEHDEPDVEREQARLGVAEREADEHPRASRAPSSAGRGGRRAATARRRS